MHVPQFFMGSDQTNVSGRQEERRQWENTPTRTCRTAVWGVGRVAITMEWARFENDWRLPTVCSDGVPLQLPTEWLIRTAQQSTSPKTPQQYAFYLTVFFRWLDQSGISLFEVTEQDLYEFRRDLDNQTGVLFQRGRVSDSTRYQVLSCTVRFLQWCIEPAGKEPLLSRKTGRSTQTRGMLRGITTTTSPVFKSLLLKPKKSTLPQSLTPNEVNRIRAWLRETYSGRPDLYARNYAIVQVMLDGTLRRGEVLSVRVQDIDFGNGLITVPLLEEEYEKAWTTGKTEALQKTGQRCEPRT